MCNIIIQKTLSFTITKFLWMNEYNTEFYFVLCVWNNYISNILICHKTNCYTVTQADLSFE